MKERNGTLDFLKFLFSLFIVMNHGFAKLDVVKDIGLFNCGFLGVEFYLLTSGCLAAFSAERESPNCDIGSSTFSFMKRRVNRLLPNVYVAWIICVIVGKLLTERLSLFLAAGECIRSFPELLFIEYLGLRWVESMGVLWYLSAMLAGLMIIYPLILKYKSSFFYIIAPLGSLFLLGYLFTNFEKGLSLRAQWNGLVYSGLIRAVAVLLLGCCCYKIQGWGRKFHLKKAASCGLTGLEWALYVWIFYYLVFFKTSKYDYLALLVMVFAVSVSFSELSYSGKFFNNRISFWLGEYSYSLYLGHSYWRGFLNKYLPTGMGAALRLAVYLGISFATALFIMYFSKYLRYCGRKAVPALRNLLLEK